MAPDGSIAVDNNLTINTEGDLTKEEEVLGVRYSHVLGETAVVSDLMATANVIRVPETTLNSYKISMSLSEPGWLYLRARSATEGKPVDARIKNYPGGSILQSLSLPNTSVSKVIGDVTYLLYGISKFNNPVSGTFYLEFTGEVLLEGIEFVAYTDDKGVWLPTVEGGYDEVVTGTEIPGKKLIIIKHNDSGYSEGEVKVLSDVAEFHSDDPKAVIVNEVSAQADIVFGSGWLVSGTRLVSNKPSPNSGSSIDITITLRSAATISFNYGVSSEPNYDKLFLLLNGSQIDEISGVVEKKFSRGLSAGVYTIRLSYYKDVS